eukprot:SM000030S11434  [mRNA]  locus=s30:599783:604452:- [translate_table: standard]
MRARVALALALAVCLGAAARCAAFSEEQPGDRHVLVLLDSLKTKSSHSVYFRALAGRGYTLDFKLADDSSLALQKYGQYLYDAAIIFAPKAESFGGSMSLAAILDFIDSGHDLVLAADLGPSDLIRDIATECGVDIDEDSDALVIDHQNYVVTSLDTDHAIVASSSLVNSTILLGSDALQAPVLYRGVGLSVIPSTDLVVTVLSASATAYTGAPGATLFSPPPMQGTAIALVTVMQARNNARVLVSGSLDLFSNKFFRMPVELPNESERYRRPGNEQFCVELTKWTLHERGHLKAVNVTHRKVEVPGEPSVYRIKDQAEYAVEIYEWSGKTWQPYKADDVQLQFYMMSPYVLKGLTHDEKGRYSVQFQIPDVYGVFQFKVDYRRLGYTSLQLSKQIPVRPYRHDEYERFIGSAYPYYAAVFSMMVGFFILGFAFLYHKG